MPELDTPYHFQRGDFFVHYETVPPDEGAWVLRHKLQKPGDQGIASFPIQEQSESSCRWLWAKSQVQTIQTSAIPVLLSPEDVIAYPRISTSADMHTLLMHIEQDKPGGLTRETLPNGQECFYLRPAREPVYSIWNPLASAVCGKYICGLCLIYDIFNTGGFYR